MHKSCLVHPFLFALYPVLLIVSFNISDLKLIEVVRLLSAVLVGVALIMLLFWIAFKDREKAGFVTSVLVILLFYINYSSKLPEIITFLGVEINRNWLVFLVWILIIIFTAQVVWKRLPQRIANRYLTITSLFILLIPVYNIIRLDPYLHPDPLDDWDLPERTPVEFPQPRLETKPDIYYIIVDGYAGELVLKSLYNFENSEFLEYLDKSGFYVAAQSKSNYPQTALSLASSLNFDYLDQLTPAGNLSNNRAPLKELIINSHSRHILENLGYQLINIYSGYEYTDIPDADVYLGPKKTIFTPLEGTLINSTGLYIIFNSLGLGGDVPGYELHRRIIRHHFEQLKLIPTQYTENPKFVFAHIVLPHPPFIYDREGNELTLERPYTINDGNYYQGSEEEYVESYVEQLIYTNDLLRTMINQIIIGSNMPPIIILQADHGPGAYLDWESYENSCLMERFSILNAYFLPGDHDSILYPTISPVNTFRVIFNSYFATELDILEDRQYYSPWLHPYQYIDATDISGQNCTTK